MLKKFEQVAISSPFVDYYGEFNGRGEHEGYAVIAEGQFEYAQFCLELVEEGLEAIAQKRPLIDHQGYDQLYSWSQKAFSE